MPSFAVRDPDSFAGAKMLFMVLLLEPLPNLASGVARLHIAQMRIKPTEAGATVSAVRFPPFTGLERIVRADAPLTFAPRQRCPTSVWMIGEIQRRRPFTQPDHLSFRRQHKDLILEQLGAKILQHRLIVILVLQQPAQGVDTAIQNRVLPAAFLVAPVSRDAVFGEIVHGPGANLDFDRPSFGPDHDGMQ